MTAFRSQTDEMLAARFDPEPHVSQIDGSRYAAVNGPMVTVFDPRPEFIPARSTETRPYWVEPHAWAWMGDADREALVGRPEPNPILVAFREEGDDGWESVYPYVVMDLDEPPFDATPEQIDHARRVLSKLAALA